MILANVKAGDIVEVDKKGRRFYALVEGKGARELDVTPLCAGSTYRHAKALEVVGHWRRSRAGRARAERKAGLESSDGS